MAAEWKIKLQEHQVAALLGGSLGLAGIYYLLRRKYLDRKERMELNAKRISRQQARIENLKKLEEKLGRLDTKEQRDIVSLPFSELVDKLQKRELTCRQVLEAFVAKSVAITKEFNCITEFVPDMFELADELDALPTVKGPFHGVPFCIKEDHDIKGMDTTLGYSKYLEKPATENSVAVQILLDAGAVPFCKTNLPQTTLSYASHNPIYGTTYNHLNKLLGPGGSSSGTGCLVGAGGASFGTGSDSGGSVRIPAHFSGISSLRPTIGRISGKGLVQGLERLAGYTGVSGILAPKASTLASVYKIMTTGAIQNEYDFTTVPLPWNEEVFKSKTPLRIGYYVSLPFIPALGDTPQTVLQAKEKLERLGHTLVPFELPDNWKILKVYFSLSGADGWSQICEKLENDEVSFTAENFTAGKTLSSKLFLLLDRIMCKENSRIIFPDPDIRKSEVLWKYLAEQQTLKNEVLSKMKNLGLDLILSPVFPFPARLVKAELLSPAVLYTCVWNLLDFPAGVVPFGKESGDKIDSYDDQGDFILKMAKEGIKSAIGMPIGVQIIGKPYHEELVLRILNELDTI